MYQFDTPYNRKGTNCTKWDIFTDEEMLPMWIADMDFEAPAPIYEAFEKRAAHHVYAYSRLSNEYYQAVIDWMQRRHQFHVEKDWIVFTPGVVVALTLGVQAVTEPGEEVMILSPVYGPFRGATTACGRKLIESPLVNNDGYYTIDFEDMEKRVTPNTKAFMLCSPHNPVGRVWTREELEGIANFCLKHNLYLIADEIHNDLIFKDHIVMNNISEQLADRTILCTAPRRSPSGPSSAPPPARPSTWQVFRLPTSSSRMKICATNLNSCSTTCTSAAATSLLIRLSLLHTPSATSGWMS